MMAEPIVSMSEAQAYVRIETGEEEALLAGLIRTASALCEAFINQAVIARAFESDLPASGSWERLPLSPVRAITQVAAVDPDGAGLPLPTEAYSIDVDSSGDGWVRVAQPNGATRVRVTGSAGIADGENDVPEPIRQGVLRLVAHLFTARDGADGGPPAAVTAGLVLRPTFGALVAAEEELGSLFELVERAAAGMLKLSEIVALFDHVSRGRPPAITRERIGEAVVETGLAGVTPILKTVLTQVLQGR